MPLQGENANADPVPRVLTLGYDGRSLSGSAAHPLKGGGRDRNACATRNVCVPRDGGRSRIFIYLAVSFGAKMQERPRRVRRQEAPKHLFRGEGEIDED
jgi:hypothetical protein